MLNKYQKDYSPTFGSLKKTPFLQKKKIQKLGPKWIEKVGIFGEVSKLSPDWDNGS